MGEYDMYHRIMDIFLHWLIIPTSLPVNRAFTNKYFPHILHSLFKYDIDVRQPFDISIDHNLIILHEKKGYQKWNISEIQSTK